MQNSKTILTKQEQAYLLAGRVTRLSDGQEVQIYPMGAERYLSSVLSKHKPMRYDIKSDIEGKNILIVPGHGNTSFIFTQFGAQSVFVLDKDPVTIAWVKAFKKYYHYREGAYPSIGNLITALTAWYPPLISLPKGYLRNAVFWLLNPNALRRTYIHYLLKLVQKALRIKVEDCELDKDIRFEVGTIAQWSKLNAGTIFDTAFIPYLLGVRNGIETEREIVQFMEELFGLIPKGSVIVNPSQNLKEFFYFGKRYFETTAYQNIQDIPELKPHFKMEDKKWFRTQGLAVFSAK